MSMPTGVRYTPEFTIKTVEGLWVKWSNGAMTSSDSQFLADVILPGIKLRWDMGGKWPESYRVDNGPEWLQDMYFVMACLIYEVKLPPLVPSAYLDEWLTPDEMIPDGAIAG
jgi:hypothetical protein